MALSKLRIWLADLTYTQQQISAELIPQAIGGIATFTESQIALEHPVRLFKYPEKLSEALEKDGIPDVVGFASYVWNAELSLAFARRIKACRPDCVVVFGGPNYPVGAEWQEDYLRNHPEIDFFIIKEGEAPFAQLIKELDRTNLDKSAIHGRLGSIHSIDENGVVHLPLPGERLKDLTQIPSPYCSGKLDEFFDGTLVPIIQTNRGCPFTCSFCVEGTKYYNKIYRNSQEKVKAELDYIGRRMVDLRKQGGRNDLFIADSNFGMYADDIDTCRSIAQCQDDYGWPEYINVATGKNQKQRVLEAARLVRGAMRLAGSVQSLDPDVLKNIRRDNIGASDLMKLALDAAEIQANSYSEIILALPGDTLEKHFGTMRAIIEAGFNRVVAYQLMLLLGSDLNSPESRTMHQMDVRYRILPRCFGRYEILGESVVAAEIEEVCVANATLPFEDYVACRRMNLMVTIFYNEAVFGALLKYLREQGLPVFRWLELLNSAQSSNKLKSLFDEFERMTCRELWTDRQALQQHVNENGVIERYLSGELGYNLLYTFKALAMTKYIDELTSMARSAAIALLEEENRDTPEHLSFIDSLLAYDAACMTNLFEHIEKPVDLRLNHDVPAYLAAEQGADLNDFSVADGLQLRFVLNQQQQDIVSRFLGLFGSDDAGVSRVLSKVYVRKLLRNPEPGVSRAVG